jgi:hypothetical protein
MTRENIQLFKTRVLRALAHLYENFPNSSTVEHSTLLMQSEDHAGGVTVELDSGTEAGTIIWLHNQGFIEGDLQESIPLEGTQKAGITNARLTAKSLRILQTAEANANGVPLGEFALASVFGPEEEIAADLLLRRLLGN